jgi:hypothetical protein
MRDTMRRESPHTDLAPGRGVLKHYPGTILPNDQATIDHPAGAPLGNRRGHGITTRRHTTNRDTKRQNNQPNRRDQNQEHEHVMNVICGT